MANKYWIIKMDGETITGSSGMAGPRPLPGLVIGGELHTALYRAGEGFERIHHGSTPSSISIRVATLEEVAEAMVKRGPL